jgi:hypothetical protein
MLRSTECRSHEPGATSSAEPADLWLLLRSGDQLKQQRRGVAAGATNQKLGQRRSRPLEAAA